MFETAPENHKAGMNPALCFVAYALQLTRQRLPLVELLLDDPTVRPMP
jgi:hypothetical protein